jgi:hypothetical protein
MWNDKGLRAIFEGRVWWGGINNVASGFRFGGFIRWPGEAGLGGWGRGIEMRKSLGGITNQMGVGCRKLVEF